MIGIGVAVVLMVGVFFLGDDKDDEADEADDSQDAAGSVAGGFPTPPMPAGGAVRGGAQPLTFETSTTVPAGGRTETQDGK
jgi:NADH-quinone oxidoreductase subunit H